MLRVSFATGICNSSIFCSLCSLRCCYIRLSWISRYGQGQRQLFNNSCANTVCIWHIVRPYFNKVICPLFYDCLIIDNSHKIIIVTIYSSSDRVSNTKSVFVTLVFVKRRKPKKQCFIAALLSISISTYMVCLCPWNMFTY